MLRVVEKPTKENEELRTSLDDLLQRGALKMLHEAREAEVEEYLQRHRETRDEPGRAQVVRNGQAAARQLVTGSGTLEVRAPRVNDRRVDTDGQRQRFRSELLPSDMRRAPKVAEVLPILYLRGLSTGDFQAALPVLLGAEATGLSPTTITRLTALGGRVPRVASAGSDRGRRRVRVGRRRPLPRPARGGSPLYAGDDRGPS